MVSVVESRTCIEHKLVSNGKHIPELLKFHNKKFWYKFCVWSTDQEMIPARNAVEAHAQDFIVKNKLLLSIVKHSYTALAHYKLL